MEGKGEGEGEGEGRCRKADGGWQLRRFFSVGDGVFTSGRGAVLTETPSETDSETFCLQKRVCGVGHCLAAESTNRLPSGFLLPLKTTMNGEGQGGMQMQQHVSPKRRSHVTMKS